MENFTPLTAALGGIIIGLATTLLWVANGRTAGVSGIAGSVYPFRRGDNLWRLFFLVGLPVGAYAGFHTGPRLFSEIPASLPAVSMGPGIMVFAGLCVGIGTRLAGGCTSGHGICGLSRFSPRSLTAVAVFMVTASLVAHLTAWVS